ncbi:MAG: hypothetical protein AB1918_00480, partial [Pseudomonadota bacterium]
LLVGCGSSTRLPATAAGDSAPPEFSLVTDIPIPAGAEMDNERSLILSDRDRWTGRVVMKLWKSAAEATAFYQAQMPGFGWEPVMSVTSGISVLSYTRGDRAATVQIEKSQLWGSTVLVTVAPRQAGTIPAAPPPANGYGTRTPVRAEPLR